MGAFCADAPLWGPLADKHALLPSAGGGIGLEVARAYLEQGDCCNVVDLAPEPSALFAQATEGFAGRLQYLGADTTEVAQIDAPLDRAPARFGPVQPLFINAAVFDMASPLNGDEAMYDRIFAVNVKAMFFVMQKVLARCSWPATRPRTSPRRR